MDHHWVMVLLTIAIGYYTYKQWEATDGQLKVMQEQTAALRTQTAYMVKQVELMQEQMAEAKRDALTVEERAAKATSTAIAQHRAALAHSQRALDASINLARSDQRAWVAAVSILASAQGGARPYYISEGEPLAPTVRVTNSGRSPALKVRTKIGLTVISSKLPFLPGFSPANPSPQESSSSTLLPGQATDITIVTAPRATKSDIAGIQSRQLSVYVYGELKYYDVFGEDREHTTLFCAVLSSHLTTFTACPFYNEAN